MLVNLIREDTLRGLVAYAYVANKNWALSVTEFSSAISNSTFGRAALTKI